MTTKNDTSSAKPIKLPEVPAEFVILEAENSSDFRLLEAAGEDSSDRKLRRFTMTAYTGGKLNLPNFAYPVVVDLSGLKITAKSRPILRDHNAAQIVGHTEAIENSGGSLKLSGVISATNTHALEVAESSSNGFPWQASIGAAAQRVAFVDRGEAIEVNGRRFTGPLYVARQSVLREVSFVALGADDQTSARMAAGGSSSQNVMVTDMAFEDWLQQQGFDAEELSEQQAKNLQAMYEAAEPPARESETDGGTDIPPAGSTPVVGIDGAALLGEPVWRR